MVEPYARANGAHIKVAMQRLQGRIRLEGATPVLPVTIAPELHKEKGAARAESATPLSSW